MSLSMRAAPADPRGIAGGFVLVPTRQLISAWRGCRRAPLGVGDFRAWLACREMLARRCTLGQGRAPDYGLAELSRLAGVSEKRARASVSRLVGAGLLAWSDPIIGFPDADPESGSDPTDPLADSIGGGRGSLAIPRRILRLLAHGARPALIATVLGTLLRCLSRARGGFKSRGRLKSSWIARLFDVDLRRVKHARKELIAIGWIAPEPADQWAENRWGRVYTIDLAWGPEGSEAGRQSPPPPATAGRRLPPPDSHPEPLPERGKDQEPASGRPAGVEVRGSGGGSIAPPTPPVAPSPPRPPVESRPEAGSRRPASVPVAGGAGTSPAGVEPVRPIPGRPAMVAGGAGAGAGPLPAPRLDDVRVEDLKDTGRLLVLLDQAIARDVVGPSEADRLHFVAAAVHAIAVGKANPPGLFCHLIRGRLWRYLTQEDEDRASARLKRHLFGGPREIGDGCRPSSVETRRLSRDAELVGEVRAALIRAGIFRDPFAAFQARNPGWTRERWDRALSELGGDPLLPS